MAWAHYAPYCPHGPPSKPSEQYLSAASVQGLRGPFSKSRRVSLGRVPVVHLARSPPRQALVPRSV